MTFTLKELVEIAGALLALGVVWGTLRAELKQILRESAAAKHELKEHREESSNNFKEQNKTIAWLKTSVHLLAQWANINTSDGTEPTAKLELPPRSDSPEPMPTLPTGRHHRPK